MPIAIAVAFLLALAGAAGLALREGRRRWRATTARMTESLRAGSLHVASASYSPAKLAALPAPVAAYLHQVLREGQRPIRRARIAWQGEFNLGQPGRDSWKPFTADQEYAVAAPGFVWDARIALLPGVPVLVRDALVAGTGWMCGRIAGLVTVVDRAGAQDLATAALQRYLGEAVWFPTALLPDEGVQWSWIDERRALATLVTDGLTASAEFHFGADGLVETVLVAQRLYDNGKEMPALHPWRARITGWCEYEGVLLPAGAVAEWLLPSGPHAYWRGGPVRVAYDFAP